MKKLVLSRECQDLKYPKLVQGMSGTLRPKTSHVQGASKKLVLTRVYLAK